MATLEQLDAWGSLDGAILNAYTLEQLDALEPLLASGTASISITESAVPTLREFSSTLDIIDGFGTLEQLDAYGTLEDLNFLTVHQASASDNIAITETANAIRVPTVSSSDTLALTTTSTLNFLVNIEGTGNISITEVANVDRFRLATGVSEIEITESIPRFTRFLSPTFVTSNVAITGECLFQRRRFLVASSNVEISTSGLAEILGETWTDVSGRAVTWSILQ